MVLPSFAANLRIVGIILTVLTSAGAAGADPLTFSNVQAIWSVPGSDGDVVTVNLFDHPGAVLSGQVVDFGPVNRAVVSFNVFVSGSLLRGASDVLRVTYHLPNIGPPPFSNLVQDGPIPFGDNVPPFTMWFGMDFPLMYRPVPMSITVDLLRTSPDFVIPSGPRAGTLVDSQTYTFSVVQPVPEPTSILLLGTGVITAMLRRGWLHRRSRE